MSPNRVQKLLFSEYCDFEDMVLIESPFAQTTREGRGIRQIHLGLTPSKFVIATDVLPPVDKSCIAFTPEVDPDIETFELIAIYPIECVNLSVFRRRKRQTIKARFCNNRVFYFELGGFEKRKMFWNLWCEKVKFLCPDYSGSSHSETSVATSTTNSTLYLVDRKQVTKPNGLKQLWCKFGTEGKEFVPSFVHKWTDRNLFMGKDFEDPPDSYLPSIPFPKMSQFIHSKPTRINRLLVRGSDSSSPMIGKEIHIGDSFHVNRFAMGVREGCSTGLFLPAEDYILQKSFSDTTDQSSDPFIGSNLPIARKSADAFLALAENSVLQWEMYRESRPENKKSRHKRRFGISPHPLFLNGLGPWNVSPGARFSIQVKRASSVVSIRRPPVEPEMRLPLAKRQLVSTISCSTLNAVRSAKLKANNSGYAQTPQIPVILFWTPDYWYRPKTSREAYLELQDHMNKLHKLKPLMVKTKKVEKRRLFRRKPKTAAVALSSNSDDSRHSTVGKERSKKNKKKNKKKSLLHFNVFHSRIECDCDEQRMDQSKICGESSKQFLKRILAMDVVLTAWDFDSTTLAQELTLIDRDLFLRITPLEMHILIWQQSSKNAPNVAAIIAFSHRISCLITTELLKESRQKTRAKLVARFINVAYKCHKIANFQSCKTILLGLQSPAIYRLRLTWAYLRKKHASKYQVFEFLCRLYKDPRMLTYQKSFFFSSRCPPYIPFIGDVLGKLLGRIPKYREGKHWKNFDYEKGEARFDDTIYQQPVDSISHTNVFTKLLMSIKLLRVEENQYSENGMGEPKTREKTRKVLCDFLKPLNLHEDNRLKCLNETIDFLQKCQLSAISYNFSSNSMALEYLLKARYKEERENFFHSFKIESLQTWIK